MPVDPVCGMVVEKETAAATSEYKDVTYYFCAPGCKTAFDEDPEKYLQQAKAGKTMPAQTWAKRLNPFSKRKE